MNIEDLKGCFANITDDLLRDNGNLYVENKELKEEIERLQELIKTLYFREDKYTFKEFTEEQLELLNNILYGSDKE